MLAQRGIKGRPFARALERAREREDLPFYAPLALAGVYLLALLVQIGYIVDWLYLNGDAAAALLIAELIDDAPPEREVFFSNYPWYESLWFMEATRWLPGHRTVWQAAPIIAAFATFGAVAWSAYRIFGAWAGATVLAVLVCLGELARLTFFTPNAHGHTAVHVVLLALVFVWAARRMDRLPSWAFGALALGVGLVTAPGVASDRLLLVAGLAPLALGATALAWHLRTRASVLLAASSLAAVVIAYVIGRALADAMVDDGIQAHDLDIFFVPGPTIVENAEYLVRGLSAFAGGAFFGSEIDTSSVIELLRASLVFLAFGVAFLAFKRRSWLPARTEARTPREAAKTAYILFWGVALVLPVAAYLLTNVPVDVATGRYFLTSYIAAAALLPVVALGDGGRRVAVTVAATLFVAAGVYDIFAAPAPNDSYATAEEVQALEDFARSEGVRRGYADFWSAGNITLASGFDLEVFPVRECGSSLRLCRHKSHNITTWYEPAERRSMLIIDSEQGNNLTRPDPGNGDPLTVRTFGQLTAYVYDHDIARRFVRSP